MDITGNKAHWENVYQTKLLHEVSWYQPIPITSLNFIKTANLTKNAAIIDIGGGDSFLVDHLLDLGYTNVSILDISEASLQRAQTRLKEKATLVKWIVSSVTDFQPSDKYDLWHDRATFHFLTNPAQINQYVSRAETAINKNGQLIIGTFSENGPKKCSGLEIKQYQENSITKTFADVFEPLNCLKENHTTPSGAVQNFLYCSFMKK